MTTSVATSFEKNLRIFEAEYEPAPQPRPPRPDRAELKVLLSKINSDHHDFRHGSFPPLTFSLRFRSGAAFPKESNPAKGKVHDIIAA